MMRHLIRLQSVAFLCALAGFCTYGARDVQAHGIWGHIHVTGWAVENLPSGELRTFFEDPEVFNAALFGAAFVDSGYWPQGGELGRKSRAYTEHTHWEPFVADFVAWMIANDPPPWTSRESKMRAAFLLGCASHGLQDEIFDSLFLDHIHTHDGAGQDEADPATDGFLAVDGHLRFVPRTYLPMEALLELYAGLPEDVTEEVIRDSVNVMTLIYVNDGVGVDTAYDLGAQYRDTLPWARANYLNPDVPGSLHAEVEPTLRYIQALWSRLHGREEGEKIIFAYPHPQRRLLDHRASDPGSTIALFFGTGVNYPSTAPLLTQNGTSSEISTTRRNTRWNETWTRLIRIQPNRDLTPGEFYTIAHPSGTELVDGKTLLGPFTQTFQVSCTDPEDPVCPPTPPPNDPVIQSPPQDVGVQQDTASDTDEDPTEDSSPDIETDPIPTDSSTADTPGDSTSPDTPQRAPDPPTTPSQKHDACACQTSPSTPPPSLFWYLILPMLSLWRARTRRANV